MKEITLILCITFLITVIMYWIMPTKKMKAVNEALKSLFQILPIVKLLEAITRKSNELKK